MKRIKAACICQTLHFMLNENLDRASAAKLIEQETENYKKNLDKAGTKYNIIEETKQPDGSVILKIIRQYNTSPVGDYIK